MKPLVFASYAQFGVNAEDEDNGRFVMAYKLRPTIRGDLFLWKMIHYFLRNRVEPALWRKLCAA